MSSREIFKRVVVTGIGFITSLDNSKLKVIYNLKNLKHNFILSSEFARVVGDIKNFDLKSQQVLDWKYPEKYKLKLEVLKSLPPQGLYCYASILNALDDSKLEILKLSNPRIGLFTASAGSPRNLYHNIDRMIKSGVSRCSPYGMVSSISGTLTFNLTSIFKIKGSSCCFVSACASSGHAIGYAYDLIKKGLQDIIIVTSGEDGDFSTIVPFAGMRALSNNLNINLASKPFDSKRDGFVGSGGGVTIILEELNHALNRNSTVYGEIAGWGQTSDGSHIVAPDKEGLGLLRCINIALKSSRLNISCIDYINAHATSTLLGDWAELKALKRLFSNNNRINFKKREIIISSTKCITGHTLSMSSALEVSLCFLFLKYNFIAGSANITTLDKFGRGLKIIRKSIKANPKVILNNSSGFGGANVCIVLKKYGVNLKN